MYYYATNLCFGTQQVKSLNNLTFILVKPLWSDYSNQMIFSCTSFQTLHVTPQLMRNSNCTAQLCRTCDHLMLYRTLPSWKILSSLLSVVTSWKLAPFSLAKNRSGFQMESSMDGSRSSESSGYSL